MDMTDIDKEIANLKLPQTKPGKRVDYSVKHASLKVLVSKALAVLFFLAVALFSMYIVTKREEREHRIPVSWLSWASFTSRWALS